MSDIVDVLKAEANRLDRRAYADRCVGPDCALSSLVAATAAAEIERLRGENEVTAADLHAWMKLKADAEARLAEAVEWVREARKFCQDGLAGDGCTPEQALERIHEASGDILAKLEGRSDAIRAMEEKP